MDITLLRGTTPPSDWDALLKKTGLTPEDAAETTVLVRDSDGVLAAAGSRDRNILKYIAVDPLRQGEDLTSTLLTVLRRDAFDAGYDHLFLYTKPRNRYLFEGLFFSPVAETGDVLLMEDKKGGLDAFVASLPRFDDAKTVGAVVMHANPFTLGHRYLIETAAGDCDRLYVFVLSEDRGLFPARDRLTLVTQGTRDLKNVTVVPSGPYMISSATFPTYFLQATTDPTAVQCRLDVELFASRIAPALHITRRYVGTEPSSPVTNVYNETLKALLPGKGIDLRELARKEQDSAPISASRVRTLLADRNFDAIRPLVPDVTYDYIITHF